MYSSYEKSLSGKIDGAKALRIFYEHSKKYKGAKFPADFAAFLKYLRNHEDRGYKILEDSLSNAIEVLREDSFFGIEDEVQESMKKLADKSKGRLPRPSAFHQALSDEFTDLGLQPYIDIMENINESFDFVLNYKKPLIIGAIALGVYLTVSRLVPNRSDR